MSLVVIYLVALCIYEHLVAVTARFCLKRCHCITHERILRIVHQVPVCRVLVCDDDAFVEELVLDHLSDAFAQIVFREYYGHVVSPADVGCIVCQSAVSIQVLFHCLKCVVLDYVQKGREEYLLPSVRENSGCNRDRHHFQHAVDAFVCSISSLDKGKKKQGWFFFLAELSRCGDEEVVFVAVLQFLKILHTAEFVWRHTPPYGDFVLKDAVYEVVSREDDLGDLLGEVAYLYLLCVDLSLAPCQYRQ